MVSRTSRRAFLATVGGLAVGVLAACRAPASPPSVKTPPQTPAARSTPAAKSTVAAKATPAAKTTQPAGPTRPVQKPAASAPLRRGGDLRILQSNDVTSMDPIHASGPTASSVFDSLFTWRPDAQGAWSIQPMLATSWELGDNRLVVKLRENVTFHDGSDMNADAIVWNISRMVQNPKSFARSYLPQVDKEKPAQALDPLTVQINMTRPSTAILSSLSDSIANTHIVSKAAADKNGEEWLKLNPVGTGPFTFVSFVSGDKLVVEKNPNYWRMGADGKPLPYADKATYRVIIEASTQLTEMQAGTADWISNVRGRDVAAARAIPHATYIESAFTGVKRQFFFNAIKPPFQNNLKLRLAIQHAVDREAMAKALGAGLGITLPYELVPGSIGYDTTVPTYEYNPDKAKQLLAESGVKLPFEVRLTAHNREADQQQAVFIQGMLEKVGIKINLDSVERVAWGEKVRINNDFEMATRQSGVVTDPSQDLLVTWAEDGSSAYHRAKVPGLLDTLQKADTEYDEKKRHALFVEAQKLMHDSAWSGSMWFENGNFLVHKRIQGFPAGWGSLREAEWWINE